MTSSPLRTGLFLSLLAALLFAPSLTAAPKGAIETVEGWLARQQQADGSWVAEGELGSAASTGLSLLAFLGAGETHKTGQYKDRVRSGLKYLVQIQTPDGSFASTGTMKLYRDHALATLALAEAYALTGSPLFREAAQRAVTRLYSWQGKDTGWSARPDAPVEMETTAWAVLASKSAKAGGLKVNPSSDDGVRKLLYKLTGPDGWVAPKVGTPGDLPSTAMAAQVRILLDGLAPDQVDVLRKNLPEWDERGPAVFDTLYWYFGNLAMFQTGGDPWKAWNAASKTAIIDHQRRDGDLRGSWDPAGPWASRAGRVPATALCTLCLECYYRYSRVFGTSGGKAIGIGGGAGGAFKGRRGSRAIAPPSTGGTREPNDNPYGDVFFKHHGVNPFVDTEDDALSTFAIDVDTASYTIARRYLRDGNLPDPASIRVEEFVNAFRNDDPPPESGTFRLVAEGMPSPFGGPRYHLLRLAMRARDVTPEKRKPARLTFVVDTSGSMKRENRIGLVKRALRLLVSRLRGTDEIALVVYGSRGEVRLRHTTNHDAILEAIAALAAGGSTNAEEGLVLGFKEARRAFAKEAINRVILCSDGVANVGKTGPDRILKSIGKSAREGISLTTIGFGMGNYNDVLLEKLADAGDGSYAYVDTYNEARRIFVENLEGMLQTVAKDAKVQVEFDPAVVSRYRLLGYENRDVADEDFRKDDVDAGEVGAGQSVTALYEIKLHRDATDGNLGTFRVRYQMPDEERVVEEAIPIERGLLVSPPSRTLRRDAAVAEFAEILRKSYWARDGSLPRVLAYLEAVDTNVMSEDPALLELIGLVKTAADLIEPTGEEPPEERPEFPEDE